MKIFCMVVLCTCLFIACEKDNDDYEPVKPPVEQPEKPEKPTTPPLTDDIINVKIGDSNMIVGSNTWNAVAYGNNRFVAVGTSGYISYSLDGNSWSTPVQLASTNNVRVRFLNGKFFCCTTNVIYSSTDGINWEKTLERSREFTDIIYADGKYMAITKECERFYSDDAINWTVGATEGYYGSKQTLCFGNGKFIMVGARGQIRWTSDPWSTAKWNVVSGSFKVWLSITFANDKFVAVGENGQVGFSTDGTTWKTKQVSSSAWCDVAYSNGKYIAVGNNGSYIISEDGENWSDPEQVKENGSIVTETLNGICAVH